MSNEKNYSANELEKIKNDINKVIVNSSSDDSKIDRNLLFSLRKNTKKINDAIEIIEEDLEEVSEEYAEYEQERIQIAQDHGGKLERTPQGGVRITNFQEIMNNEDFKEDLSNLSDEYSEVLDEQREKFQKNEELRNEEIAEVDWQRIPLSKFPKDMSGDEMPLSFLEFVYQDDEPEIEN